jgi:hypothetical protein
MWCCSKSVIREFLHNFIIKSWKKREKTSWLFLLIVDPKEYNFLSWNMKNKQIKAVLGSPKLASTSDNL